MRVCERDASTQLDGFLDLETEETSFARPPRQLQAHHYKHQSLDS